MVSSGSKNDLLRSLNISNSTAACMNSFESQWFVTRHHLALATDTSMCVMSLISAVFKLGSADQMGSATGSQGVRERIPKSSNCLHGF